MLRSDQSMMYQMPFQNGQPNQHIGYQYPVQATGGYPLDAPRSESFVYVYPPQQQQLPPPQTNGYAWPAQAQPPLPSVRVEDAAKTETYPASQPPQPYPVTQAYQPTGQTAAGAHPYPSGQATPLGQAAPGYEGYFVPQQPQFPPQFSQFSQLTQFPQFQDRPYVDRHLSLPMPHTGGLGSPAASPRGVTASPDKFPRARRRRATDSSGMSEATALRNRCPECQKQFKRPSSLQTHMHSHTGAKPYYCSWSGCGRAFSVRSNMTRHMKLHERDEKECGAVRDERHSDTMGQMSRSYEPMSMPAAHPFSIAGMISNPVGQIGGV